MLHHRIPGISDAATCEWQAAIVRC
jgi:hypothetical protein